MPAADYRPTEIVVAPQDTRLEIEQMVLLDPAEFEVDETTPDRLPSAMLAYKLLLDQPGQRALVTIHLSDPAPEDARWLKYDAVNGWQGYSDFTAFSADRQTVTVEVKDGAFGDADGVTNGIILIPAGLSTAEDSSSVASSSGGGGGVFDPRHLGGNGRRKSTPGTMGIYRVDPPAFQHLERLSGKEYIRCVSLSQMTALDHHFFPQHRNVTGGGVHGIDIRNLFSQQRLGLRQVGGHHPGQREQMPDQGRTGTGPKQGNTGHHTDLHGVNGKVVEEAGNLVEDDLRSHLLNVIHLLCILHRHRSDGAGIEHAEFSGPPGCLPRPM
jgi:hypothetical protein